MFAFCYYAFRWIICATVLSLIILAWVDIWRDFSFEKKAEIRQLNQVELRVKFGGQEYGDKGTCEPLTECQGTDVACNPKEDCGRVGFPCGSPARTQYYQETETCEPPGFGYEACVIEGPISAVCTYSAPCICNTMGVCKANYDDVSNNCITINFAYICEIQEECP